MNIHGIEKRKVCIEVDPVEVIKDLKKRWIGLVKNDGTTHHSKDFSKWKITTRTDIDSWDVIDGDPTTREEKVMLAAFSDLIRIFREGGEGKTKGWLRDAFIKET